MTFKAKVCTTGSYNKKDGTRVQTLNTIDDMSGMPVNCVTTDGVTILPLKFGDEVVLHGYVRAYNNAITFYIQAVGKE